MKFRKKALVIAVSSAVFVAGCTTMSGEGPSIDELKQALIMKIERKRQELTALQSEYERANTEYQELRALNERAKQLNTQLPASRGYVGEEAHISFTYPDQQADPNPPSANVQVVPVSPKTAEFQRVRSRLELMERQRMRFDATDEVPELPTLYDQPSQQPVMPQPQHKEGTHVNYRPQQEQVGFIKANYNARQSTSKALPDLSAWQRTEPQQNNAQYEEDNTGQTVTPAVYRDTNTFSPRSTQADTAGYLTAGEFVMKYKQLDAYTQQKQNPRFIKAAYQQAITTTQNKATPAYQQRKQPVVTKNKESRQQTARRQSDGLPKGVYYDVAYVLNDQYEARAMEELLNLHKIRDKQHVVRDGRHYIHLGIFQYSFNAKNRIRQIAGITGKKPTVSKRQIN